MRTAHQVAPEPSSYESARRILGFDFIMPEELVAEWHEIEYDSTRSALLEAVLPSEQALYRLKARGCGLVPKPVDERSFLDVGLRPDYFPESDGGDHGLGIGWIAVRKTLIDGSVDTRFGDMYRLSVGPKDLPSVAQAAWFMTMFSGVRAEPLFKGVCFRTSSARGSYRACVGRSEAGRFLIQHTDDDQRFDNLGFTFAQVF